MTREDRLFCLLIEIIGDAYTGINSYHYISKSSIMDEYKKNGYLSDGRIESLLSFINKNIPNYNDILIKLEGFSIRGFREERLKKLLK